MTTAWICATPRLKEAYATEREAESRAHELVQSMAAAVAVTYRVEVEDEERR